MALPVFQRTIVTEAGDVIAGAEVEVVLESTGLAADIFSNRDGSTPLTNPFFTGADGFAKFFAAPNEYRITATGPSGGIVFRFVVLTGDSARRDVGTGATQVPTNSDLGTMSTQNANAVAITGGSVSGASLTTANATITGGSASLSTAAVTDTTDATSTTAAPLKTAGGLAVAKKAFFGDDVNFANVETQRFRSLNSELALPNNGTFVKFFTVPSISAWKVVASYSRFDEALTFGSEMTVIRGALTAQAAATTPIVIASGVQLRLNGNDVEVNRTAGSGGNRQVFVAAIRMI